MYASVETHDWVTSEHIYFSCKIEMCSWKR